MRASRSGACLAGCIAVFMAGTARAQPAPKRAEIYTCVLDARKITRDRYITECNDREQRVVNSDGSFNRIVLPTLTPDQQAEADEKERGKEATKQCLRDAANRDRNLNSRFPNEASHRKAREAALNNNTNAIAASQARLARLQEERKPYLDEAEFYLGKTMPTKLRTLLDTNQILIDAQRTLIQNQETEIGRINQNYDIELVHLKKLWAGAKQGFEANCEAPDRATAAKR